jgi:SPP1 gp7 family putative phage head morphogenesis protein
MNNTKPANKRAHNRGPVNASNQKNGISRRDQAVINKIITQFTSRSRVDIDKWREAIKSAEDIRYPKRDKWALIYKDLDLDNHWTAQVLIRKLSAISKEFRIVNKKTKQEDEVKTAFIKAPWFYSFLNIAFEAEFKGTRVVEIEGLPFGDMTEDAVYEVPTENVVPEFKEVLYKSTDRSGSGYKYADDPYIIEIKEQTFMGLMCKAAPQLIWKKNAQQSWAEFCEKFGIPMRYATTNKKDKATIDRIEKMLDSLGSAARAIFPEGTTLDFKEANTSDSFNVFDKMIERNNSEVSKLVNGVTMLSDNGSSKSQSSVHFDVNKQIVKSDNNRLASIVNWRLIPKLQILGVAGFNPETDEFQWDLTETLTKAEQWEIVKGILQYFDIDEKWVAEQFGIPITGVKENVVPNNTANFKKGQPQPAASGQFSIAGYNAILSKHKHHHHELNMSGIDELFLKAAERIFKDQNNKPSILKTEEWNDLYSFIAEKLHKGVEQGYGKSLIDEDITTPDEELLKKLRENMYFFSAFKNYQLAKTLNANLLDSKGNLREWDDFKSLALQANNQYNVNWLHTEYDTAIGSAQSAARWTDLWAQRETHDVMYQTVGDNHVRPKHATYNGMVFAMDDPIVDLIAPVKDWGCRCELLAVAIGSRTRTDSSTVSIAEPAKGFSKGNVGKTGTVFNTDHPYWDGVSAADKKALNKIANDKIKGIDNQNE